MKISVTTEVSLHELMSGIATLTNTEKMKFIMKIIEENADHELGAALIKKIQKHGDNNQPAGVLPSKVYLVVMERAGDGVKCVVSAARRINSHMGDVTEEVFHDKAYAEKVAAHWRTVYYETLKSVHVKEIIL